MSSVAALEVVTAKRDLKEAVRSIAKYGTSDPLFSLWLNKADAASTSLRLNGHDVAPIIADWEIDLRQDGLPYVTDALVVVR